MTDDVHEAPAEAIAPDRDEPAPPPAAATTAAKAPRRRRRRWPKILAWTAGVLVVLLTVAGSWSAYTVRRAFAQYDGVIRLPGLSAPVTVYRDDHAIPQLFAKTADDLFTAQGYVAAQERFFEMDFRRHVTSGRLSEMFGDGQIDTDKFLRTMGWRRVAEQEWDIITPQTRQYMRDYANGVNAYLNGRSTARVSLEYSVLGLQSSGYEIAPWDPIDSLAWLKALAYDLRGNMDEEITRAQLLGSGLSRAQVDSLYPGYPFGEHAPIVDGGTVAGGQFVQPSPAPANHGAAAVAVPPDLPPAALKALAAVKTAVDGLPDLVGDNFPGIGSNAWAISGSLTASGKPILANDPHLAPTMPGIWYQMGLHCDCPFNVEGFTFSGVPGVIIGHNGDIAWGFTNLDPDVTDLYVEKIRGHQYEVDGVWKDLTERTEVLRVAGGKPVTITVRATDHGPLLSDVSDDIRDIAKTPDVDPSGNPVTAPGGATGGPGEPGVGYAVALRWTALDPHNTADAIFAIDSATGWADFQKAAELFAVPAQNMVYADTRGNIGYQSPGLIPIRGRGDGRWPAPGWDSAYDWTGYIPFAELPHELNPPKGYAVTANQAVIDPATYQPFLTADWGAHGYRSQRITNLIEAASGGTAGPAATGTTGDHKITVADVQAMQFDNRNDFAAQIVPALLGEHLTGEAARAARLLDGWDFQQPADGPSGSAAAHSSAAASYFNAFWHDLVNRLFDELPADNRPDGDDRWFSVVNDLFADPTNAWWDVKSTAKVETRDDVVTASMAAAADALAKSQGDDPTGWRWGAMHTLYVQNQSLGSSGIAPIEWLFNAGPVPVSGGSAIVNATGSDISEGYDVNAVPSMRMVVDLSNLDASRWIQLTGESGHAFSAHYHDQLDLWRAGKTLPMPWTEPTIRAAAKDTLTLRP